MWKKAFSQIWNSEDNVFHVFLFLWFLPGQVWYLESTFSRTWVFSGKDTEVLPFGAVFTELFFIMWLGSGSKSYKKKLLCRTLTKKKLLCSGMQGSVQQRCWFVSHILYSIWFATFHWYYHGELIYFTMGQPRKSVMMMAVVGYMDWFSGRLSDWYQCFDDKIEGFYFCLNQLEEWVRSTPRELWSAEFGI